MDFPVFPDPEGNVELVDERVVMSLEYWERVFEYKVRVDECKRVWQDFCEVERGH